MKLESVLTGRGSLARRAVWTMLDQALSSLATAALSLILARALTSSAYGTFALSFAFYTFALGVSQAVGAQIISIRFVNASSMDRHRAVSAAAGNALIVGAAACVTLVTVGLVLDLQLLSVALAVAVALPTLLLQDTWRTILISQGRPRSAFANDVVWAVVQFASIGVLLTASASTGVLFVAAWGVSGAVAALLGVWQTRTTPNLRGSLKWAAKHRDLSGNLLIQWITVLGMTQFALILLAALGGVSTVGSLRAAQTLLGPLNLIGMAITVFAVPELIRAAPSSRTLAAITAAISAMVLLVSLAWGGVLLSISDGLGGELLGQTWPTTRDVLPGMVVYTCAVGVTTGPLILFRVIDESGYIVKIGLLLGPAILACSLIGQHWGGASGAAWGFAAAATLALPLALVYAIVAMKNVATRVV